MRIAVATVDGESVLQHFGQSTGFIVFEVKDQQIKSRALRATSDTPHNEGVCHIESKLEDSHVLVCGGAAPATSGTTHKGGVLGLLQGCDVLICGGMGGGAAAAVQSAGIQPVLLPGVLHAEDAVKTFLAGKGNNAAAGFCQCDHHH